MRCAESCGVMSSGMSREYSSKYGVRTVLLRYGVAKKYWADPKTAIPSSTQVTIGYSGTVYAKKEWDTLIKVLQLFPDEYELLVLSKKIDIYTDMPINVKFRGWQSVDSTINHLSNCDILYLPYWFTPDRQESVRLCFPSKMSTYLAAGKPVLYHGPSDSTPSEFLRKYQVGMECNISDDVDKLATSFKRLLKNKQLYLNYSQERHKALENELAQDVFYKNFAKFIKIPFELLSK